MFEFLCTVLGCKCEGTEFFFLHSCVTLVGYLSE